MQEVLKISNLKKSFNGKEVLSGISFNVKHGEVVAVIGPSGSGKSTILRSINMLERIDGGRIEVEGDVMVDTKEDGRVVYADEKKLREIKLRFGMVFQNFNLFPHYSVLRNVIDAPICVKKMDKQKARELGLELLEKMGLKDKADAYPYQLSGGQCQRVAIARALAMKPDILFFDEPTSALDPELTGEVLKVMRNLAAEHMTMVVITHEMKFARDVADKVVFIDKGQVLDEGHPEDIIDNPSNERIRAFLRIVSQ